jgi:hypothetical protein
MKLTPEVKVTKKRDPLAILQIFDRFFTPRPSLWFSFPKHWIFFDYHKCLTKVLNFGVTVEILVYNKVHVYHSTFFHIFRNIPVFFMTLGLEKDKKGFHFQDIIHHHRTSQSDFKYVS